MNAVCICQWKKDKFLRGSNNGKRDGFHENKKEPDFTKVKPDSFKVLS